MSNRLRGPQPFWLTAESPAEGVLATMASSIIDARRLVPPVSGDPGDTFGRAIGTITLLRQQLIHKRA